MISGDPLICNCRNLVRLSSGLIRGNPKAAAALLCGFSLAVGQYGSQGAVRQPRTEAWSVRARVARGTIGRASSARRSNGQVVPFDVGLLNPGDGQVEAAFGHPRRLRV